MDVFIEKIIAKKKDNKDYAVIAGTVVAVFAAILIIPVVPYIRSLSMFFYVLVFYGAYRFTKTRNMEYEYSVTNGEIDIDLIIDKRKRKRVISANSKDFEILARLNSEHYNDNTVGNATRIEAVSSMKAQDIYFFITNRDKEKVIVFFEPDERMLNSFKTYIPRKVLE